MSKVTADNLNAVMEFDRVIEVRKDGSVAPMNGNGPYIELSVDPAGEDNFYLPAGWELLSGFTGQHGYSGPVMHPSEYIGGSLAAHILETPGYYVAVTVESLCPPAVEDADSLEDNSCDCEPAGWAVAFKPSE